MRPSYSIRNHPDCGEPGLHLARPSRIGNFVGDCAEASVDFLIEPEPLDQDLRNHSAGGGNRRAEALSTFRLT
jgi:hypothetical protein